MDPSSLCSQGVTQSEAGLGNGGLNKGGSGLPFECSGIDQVRPSLGSQLPKLFIEKTNQFQLLSPEQQLQKERKRQRRLQQQLRLQRQQQEELQLRLQEELLQQDLPLEQQEDAARFLLAQSLGSSIQPSSPKVGVDSQDQQELTMEASSIRSLPSSLYSQGVAQSKSGLVNGGGSSFDDVNGIESLKVRSKCKEKLWSNTSSPVDNDSDQSVEMGSDEINLIGSQTPKVKSKCRKKRKSLVWKFYKRNTEKDGKERAQCIKCGVKYLIDSKTIGTSTLGRHVKKCSRNETHDVGQLEPKDQGPEPFQEESIIEARTPERQCVPRGRWSRWIDLTSPASGLLEPKDQGPEPIQEENIIEVRTPERPCVPQPHISLAVQSAAGVLGTTPAVTTKRRRLAERHTESDESVCSKTSAFRPTSHDSANKSAAGTEADEGKSSTSPAATQEEVQAPRDLQPSLATAKSGPQEESGSVQQQFASAEELSSIGEQKKALKFMLNCFLSGILDSLSKGQIECLGSAKIAVDRVLRDAGSAVDVKPLEAIFTELFASSKEWQSIQDPASLYQSEVLDPHARLRRDLKEERELANKERSSRDDKFKQAKLYEEKSDKQKEIILSSLDQLEVLDRAMLREVDEEQKLENEEQSSWIDSYRRQLLLDMDKNLKHQENIKTEATKRLRRIEERVESKISRLKTFVSKVEGILGVGLGSAVPEVAAQKYAAHKREAMKAQLQDFSGKIKDFFEE